MILILLGLALLFQSAASLAGETELTLPPVVFSEEASFQVLGRESKVPSKTITMDATRGSTLDEMKWESLYPMQNYGYPGGASGISLGGRSIDDTQVTSLGVPLNLPQGGGADFSFFPSFLWSRASLTPTTQSAGYSPQSASGSLELTPWTWSILKESGTEPASRLTGSYEQDLQTLSVATRLQDISILAGTTLGMQTGPAGSLTYRFYKSPRLTLIAHIIGADQDSDDPGPTTLPSIPPTPGARKKTLRVMPSIESSYQVSEGFSLHTTIYSDLQRLDYVYDGSSDSHDQTQAFGVENALVWGKNRTLSASARMIQFENGTSGIYQEYPAFFGWTEGFSLGRAGDLRVTASGAYLSGMGIHPGGRLSWETEIAPRSKLFAEAQVTPKLPSILDRLYVLGTFHGNPNLTPENVYAFTAGFQDGTHWLKSKTVFRAEYRTSLILITQDFTTMMNSGSAELYSVSEELKAPLFSWMTLKGQGLYTWSLLHESGFSYPGLPPLSLGGSLQMVPHDGFELESQAKWMGEATQRNGSPQAAYLLFGQRLKWAVTRDLDWGLGVDNILDERAEAVPGYPLPGRRFYTSVEARF